MDRIGFACLAREQAEFWDCSFYVAVRTMVRLGITLPRRAARA